MSETVYSLSTMDMPNITSIRNLSKDEFDEISQSIRELEKFSQESALYNIIELNFQDLEDKLELYLNQYGIDSIIGFNQYTSKFLDLNRIILNMLSSIRTYLDHTETRLKKRFGVESDEYEFFKKLTSECYDKYFSYRFLSKLRNYSQHCGLPAGNISLKDDIYGRDIKISFNRDSLLSDYDSWGLIVKPELEAQNEEFDIIPLLNEKASLLKKINEKLNLKLIEKLNSTALNLLKLIDETQQRGKGIPCLIKISGSKDNPLMNIRWFPFDTISQVTKVKIQVISKHRN